MKFLSRFHRGRHRAETKNPRVSDIVERINSEYFGEYDPDGPAWQMTSDQRYFMFTGTIGVAKEPGGDVFIPKKFDPDDPNLLTIAVDPPCPHTNRRTHYEWEDSYSDGSFGIPASNLPIGTEMVGAKTTCDDCGKRLFMDPETGVIVCDGKQGWHADE